jgi:hypothetical protein
MRKYLATFRFEVEFEAHSLGDAEDKVNDLIDSLGSVDTGDMHWPDIDYNILVDGDDEEDDE